MKAKTTTLIGLAALLVTSAQAQLHEYDIWENNYTIQGLLGAVRYDALRLDIADSTTPQELNYSVLPQLGGAWSTLPQEQRFQYGLEAAFLFGFKVDRINYIYLGGGGARVDVSTSMWMFDLSGGAYLSLFPGKSRNVRLYGGAGPLLMYTDYRAKREFEDETLNDETNLTEFGLGVYARAGIEFRTQEYGMVGLGARGNWTHMNLTDIGGTEDLSGIAVFISYTAGF